ncbi:Arm DNA-binding domain-containing protein [Desulfovibrio piger]|uniref:Arm DNA-binding domain-containing protein n=1 Tax=Desulfovibrio piger TaxID=901 RepID=UPI0026EBEB05|nr:Arm DNA-binding domain-containing protein [Desulfovibrio piger]MDD6248336.1 Arm DNA-binding domain-containing protein [Desulfovibrio piger]
MSGINKLTDRQIKNLKPGARRIKIGDGDKLWLFVSPSGIKVWRMLWKEGNTQKQFTIGPYPTISLKEAREKRDAVNGLLVQGLDPNEQYRSEQEHRTRRPTLPSALSLKSGMKSARSPRQKAPAVSRCNGWNDTSFPRLGTFP